MHRTGGNLRRETIGRYPNLSLAEARHRARHLLGHTPYGPAAGLVAKRTGPTYRELAEMYVEKHLRPNARSWKVIRSTLFSPHTKPLLARRVAGIARRDIRDLIDGIVAAGTPQAALTHHVRLNMLFKWAVGTDLIETNPAAGLRPPAKMNERDRVLSDSEIAAVWRGIEQLPAPFGQMYRLLFLTGQRLGEVSTMRWSEIEGTTWTLPREKTKMKRAHAVPLTQTAMDVLATLPRFGGDGFVFSTTAGEKAVNSFTKAKAKLDAVSAVPGWTNHDIRRTVRSKLAELGVSREIAERVVNHATGKIERIYNRHEYVAEKREALERWEKRLVEIMNS